MRTYQKLFLLAGIFVSTYAFGGNLELQPVDGSACYHASGPRAFHNCMYYVVDNSAQPPYCMDSNWQGQTINVSCTTTSKNCTSGHPIIDLGTNKNYHPGLIPEQYGCAFEVTMPLPSSNYFYPNSKVNGACGRYVFNINTWPSTPSNAFDGSEVSCKIQQ